MKLSHTTKVKVRKALAALQRSDGYANADDPMTEYYGAQEFVAQSHRDHVRRIVRKAGFSDRNELEAFAEKHRLGKVRDAYFEACEALAGEEAHNETNPHAK